MSERGFAEPFYFSGAILTLVSSIVVMVSYIKFKALRQHPSGIIFWRSVLDFVFAVHMIILYAYRDGRENSYCTVFAWFFQFTVLGSQTLYFWLVSDMLGAVAINPFVNVKTNLRLYLVATFVLSTVTASVLVGANDVSYRQGLDLCWIESTSQTGGAEQDINPYNWVLLFGIILLYYAVGVFATVFVTVRLYKGFGRIFKTREHIFSILRYVFAFALYWTVAGGFYARIYVIESEEGIRQVDDHKELYAAFGFVIAFRGLVDAIVFIWNNKEFYSTLMSSDARHRAVSENIAEKIQKRTADLNLTLRTKMVMFATEGIHKSVKEARDGQDQLSQAAGEVETRTFHLEKEGTEVIFVDYGPQLFRQMRDFWGIDDAEYTAEVKGPTSILKEQFTEGAGGSFFYWSARKHYMLKTLNKEEAKFLQHILPQYAKYMMSDPDTLITHFMGFHSVRQTYTLTPLYFVVMKSVFTNPPEVPIHVKYDLKGSTVNRNAKKGSSLLLDNDLKHKFAFTPLERSKLRSQAAKDAHFLASLNIMDYSLLVGVHNSRYSTHHSVEMSSVTEESWNSRRSTANSRYVPFNETVDGGMAAAIIEGPGVYYVGIIDILQEWNRKKKLERFAKVWIAQKDGNGISATPPFFYCDRFIKNINEITEIEDLDTHDPLSLQSDMSSGSLQRMSLSTRVHNNTPAASYGGASELGFSVRSGGLGSMTEDRTSIHDARHDSTTQPSSHVQLSLLAVGTRDTSGSSVMLDSPLRPSGGLSYAGTTNAKASAHASARHRAGDGMKDDEKEADDDSALHEDDLEVRVLVDEE